MRVCTADVQARGRSVGGLFILAGPTNALGAVDKPFLTDTDTGRCGADPTPTHGNACTASAGRLAARP